MFNQHAATLINEKENGYCEVAEGFYEHDTNPADRQNLIKINANESFQYKVVLGSGLRQLTHSVSFPWVICRSMNSDAAKIAR